MVFLNVFSTLEIWMFFLWKNIHGFFSRCFLKDWISPPCVHRKGSWPRCVPVWGEATVWKICWHKIVFDFSFAELFDRISYMFQNPNSIVIQRSGKITSSIFKYSMFKRKIDQKTVHLPIFHCLFCGSCSSQLPPPPAESFRTNSGGHPHIDFVISTYQKPRSPMGRRRFKKTAHDLLLEIFWRMTQKMRKSMEKQDEIQQNYVNYVCLKMCWVLNRKHFI